MINIELIPVALVAFESQTVALMSAYNYQEDKYPQYLKNAIKALKELHGEE